MARLGLVLAAAAPLAFYDGIVAAFTLPKLVLLSAAVLAGALGGAAPAKGNIRPARTALDLPLLAAAAALAVSTWRSDDRFLSMAGTYNYYAYGVLSMAVCALLYLLAAWSRDERAASAALSVALGAAGVAAAYAVVQSLGIEPFPVTGGLFNGRPVATLGSPIALGAYLALVFPLGLYRALDERRDRTAWAVLAVLAAGLAASRSRGGWAGAAAGALAYLVLRAPARRRAGVLALGAALCAGGLAARSTGFTVKDVNRVEIWKIAGRIFLENPWFGSGPDTVELGFRRLKGAAYIHTAANYQEFQAYAHNDILQALATTGVFGCAAYLYLLVCLTLAARRAMKEPARPWAAALGSGLLSLFLVMKVNPVPLEVLALAALFAGLLCRPGPDARAWHPKDAAVWLLILAAGLSSAFCTRLWTADRQIKVAQALELSGDVDQALRRLQGGIELNPGELVYRLQLVNFLSLHARTAPSHEAQLALIDLAASAGREAVARHPRISLSHYALGVASLMEARLGRTDRLTAAEEELDAALRLDPHLGNLLQTRIEAAQLRGDAAKVSELRLRLAALRDRG